MNKLHELVTANPLADDAKPRHEVSLIDREDPRALINLVNPSVQRAMERVAQENPEWLLMSERELYKELSPSDMDDCLRLQFWTEYNWAQDNFKNLRMGQVYNGITTRENFFTFVIKNPKRMAWIMNPPQGYMTSLEAMLNRGRPNLDLLLQMKLVNDEGKMDYAAAKIFLKAYELVENRVKGGAVQNIAQKTATLHVHKDAPEEDVLKNKLEKLRMEQEAVAIEITSDKTSNSEGT